MSESDTTQEAILRDILEELKNLRQAFEERNTKGQKRGHSEFPLLEIMADCLARDSVHEKSYRQEVAAIKKQNVSIYL